MITLTITLTTAGADTGPFNIFSDASVPPFSSALNASPISRNDILAGVTLTNVPDTTTVIRVQSLGNCSNFIDIEVTPPSQCAQFLFQAGDVRNNTVTYKDCVSGEIVNDLLNNGESELKCAYTTPPYYPAFTSGSGTITIVGSCSGPDRFACTQYTIYATPGGGGATFRYIPCNETSSIVSGVSDGDTIIICVNRNFVPQLVSGEGGLIDMGVSCVASSGTTSTTSTTSTSSTLYAP